MPRQVPHFKTRLSLQNHEDWIGVYDDDALLAMRERIGMMAVERFADRTGDSFLASNLDLCRLANATPVANAVRKLLRLCRAGAGLEPSRSEAASRLELSREGAWWRLTYPKFAEEQGFSGGNGKKQAPPSSSASSSASSATSREESEEGSRPAKPAPDAPRKRPKPVAPETHPDALVFAEKFLRALGSVHTDPPIKLPTDSAFAGWQRDARRMLTVDGRSFEDAKRVASWLFNDTGQDAAFWRKNILSVGTFRKQFDRLAAAMKTPPHGGRDEFHGSKILRYLATQPPADPRPRAGGTVQDPEPPLRSVAQLAPGER